MNCTQLELNSLCAYEEIPAPSCDHFDSATADDVTEVLSQVPNTLGYEERFPINCAVFSVLGEEGKSILSNHWATDIKEKLKSDLDYQLKHMKFGNYGTLVKEAKKYGYKPKTGKGRKNIEVKLIDNKFEKLLSPDEASRQLREIAKDFFQRKRSCFVNFTTGAGKTRTLIEILATEMAWNKQILVLVPSHDLGKEIEKDFNEAKLKLSSNVEGSRAKVIRMEGRDSLCEYKPLLNKYRDVGEPLPWQECLYGCPHHGVCRYTSQFKNSIFQNIRIMTHSEWVNQQSVWFHGTVPGQSKGKHKRRWIPEFIIIDENIINPPNEPITEDGRIFQSIWKIVSQVNSGKSLQEAVVEYYDEVVSDSDKNIKPKKPKFIVGKYYLDALLESKKQSSYSEILERLFQYCVSEDPNYLKGMWVEDNKLNLLELRLAEDRYKNIPTLFLDATANKSVIRQLMPDIEFRSIKVKSNDHVKIHQLSNSTVTKHWLKNPKHYSTLVLGLKKIIQPYKNVGLITYLTIPTTKNFDQKLAGDLGITTYAHFGGPRGVNKFSDVDCLLIVGRHFIGTEPTRNYAHAIFNHFTEYESTYLHRPILMKDGSCVGISNMVPLNELHYAVHEHFSKSETKQAIGRARPVYGVAKDVFILSNESMGDDVEISDFFKWADYFDSPILSDEVVQKVTDNGFLYLQQSDMMEELELTVNVVKKNRIEIMGELVDAGMQLALCTGRFSNGTKWSSQREYLISDESKLRQAYADSKETLIEVQYVEEFE